MTRRRAYIHFAGHHLDLACKRFREVFVECGRDPFAARKLGDGDAIHVAEVIVVVAEPAVVEACIGEARTQPDQKPGQLAIDTRNAKVVSIVCEPAHLIQRDSTDMRDRGLVQFEDFRNVRRGYV